MLQDVRFALRLLRKNPGYAAVAAATLALGIGANTAIFSVVDAVLLRSLPYAHADRLVVPVSTNPQKGFDRASIPFADYLDWREQRDVFDGVAAFSPGAADLTGGDQPERVEVNAVTEEFFDVMARRPVLGRTFVPADHAADAPRVVVLSDGLWRRVFGADASVVGREIALSGVKVTVVGVMPPRAVWPDDTDVWTPVRPSLLNEDVRTRRDNMIYLAIARLKDGVPIEQGIARVQAIAARVAREHPDARAGWSSNLVPLRDYVVGNELRLALLVLTGAVGFVLLIACANVANLLLARGAARQRELAVKAAIGASHGRLVRQLLTESATLAAVGGAAGIVLGYWLTRGLVALAPADVPLVTDAGMNGVVLAASAAASLLTVVAFGLVPAFSVSGAHAADALRLGLRSATEGRHTGRLRAALIVGEIATAIVLLVGAGLMLRSVERMQRVDPGADIDRVIAGRISIPAARYRQEADRAAFLARLIDELKTLPGAENAAATSALPVGGPAFRLGRVFLREGEPAPPAGRDHQATWSVVTPGYFATLGIPLVEGRDFSERDTADSTPVIIINQTMARQTFGESDPLGVRIRSWRDENVLREIVGVVADVRFHGLADKDTPLVYVPHRQNTWSGMTIAVRAATPAALATPLRQAVARLDPNLAVAELNTMRHFAAASIASPRFSAMLMAGFAGLAVTLAAIGIYGVMAYSVSRRTHEIGLRVALGAEARDVVTLVVGRGLALTAAGTVLGLIGALAITRVLGDLLFQVSATDPFTFTAVPAILGLVAVIACYVPARRATRVDPMVAFRSE